MKQFFPQVSVAMLHGVPNQLSIGDNLLLNDNLDAPIIMEEADREIHINTPVQYVSTMYLMICVEGSMEFKISLAPCQMKAGDVLFMKTGTVVEFTDMTPNCKFINIILNEKFYFPIFNTIDMSALQRALSQHPIVGVSKESLNECILTYRLMKSHVKNQDSYPFQLQIIQGYLHALFFHIYGYYLQLSNQMEEKQATKASRQQELFNRFMEILQRDFRSEHNIKYYADQLCVTPRYLSRIINEVSGLFASDHIDNFLITEAKQLIRSRQYTILQISEMLHFTSQSFFGRYFKNHTGYTPIQYQNLE